MKLETIAIHAGNIVDPFSKAAIQPITLSTTFQRGEQGDYPGGHMYTRVSNPNRASLENLLAKLEGAGDACAFSSGNAAASAVFQSLEPGSHVLVPDDMYNGLKNLLKEIYSHTLDITFIDMTDPDLVARSIKPHTTKLIWIESPSNPMLKVSDIRNICTIAKAYHIVVCCDNTFATPVFQRPLELGADLVMYSSTKYFGGHSDVLGGALLCKSADKFWQKLRTVQSLAGASPSPLDCYLTVRGIKTLPYRMRGHAFNAMQIATFLQSHPSVQEVFYPGLENNPDHELAKSQMSGFSGMLSFTVKAGEEAARKIANSVQIILQATSLGGVESLIEHRSSMEGPDSKAPANLLRMSVGLENAEDLIADLHQAFLAV